MLVSSVFFFPGQEEIVKIPERIIARCLSLLRFDSPKYGKKAALGLIFVWPQKRKLVIHYLKFEVIIGFKKKVIEALQFVYCLILQ